MGSIGMNKPQRMDCMFETDKPVEINTLVPGASEALSGMTVGIDFASSKSATPVTLEQEDISDFFRREYKFQILRKGQKIAMFYMKKQYFVTIEDLDHALGGSNTGQLLPTTNVTFRKSKDAKKEHIIQFSGGDTQVNESLFKSDFDFEKMGIGGLGGEFQTIFRRAFAPRIFPGIMKEMGANFVRGMLLYGPPGCGKTLIARQIGKVLNAREPKIINGPEVLNKYVGGSEEKIRELFADAEQEQAEMGDASMLHIIIFDEMDAVMKQRGSSSDSTGVSDSIVNQLLSKIDGVDSLNNILIIGMTNRKDMIDEAILRPGRLEMHVEIGLPSADGRLQIINIHTAKMRNNNRIADEALERLEELSVRAKNFTGAEIEGLVRNATSYAIERSLDLSQLGNDGGVEGMKSMDKDAIKVTWPDFERALEETVPAFGSKDKEELTVHTRNPLISYGDAYESLQYTLKKCLQQLKTGGRTQLMTVLLEGDVATGKTAIAAKLALDSDLPFIRMISPDSLIGKSEVAKINILQKTFLDSYKTPLSIIFLDDLERIIDFTPVGMRFSNPVLQTLLILLRKVPPVAGRGLMIVATTAIEHLLQDLQLPQAFNVTLHVSKLQNADEIQKVLEGSGLTKEEAEEIGGAIGALESPIGIKQLLMVLEMARANADGALDSSIFLECLHTCGF